MIFSETDPLVAAGSVIALVTALTAAILGVIKLSEVLKLGFERRQSTANHIRRMRRFFPDVDEPHVDLSESVPIVLANLSDSVAKLGVDLRSHMAEEAQERAAERVETVKLLELERVRMEEMLVRVLMGPAKVFGMDGTEIKSQVQ